MYFNHPFISKPKLAIYYFLFWLVALIADILLMWLAYDYDPLVAAINFFAFPLMFSFIGIPIWFVIKFSALENSSVGKIILTHLVAATFIVIIWLYLAIVIIKLIHPDILQQSDDRLPWNIFMGYILYVIYVVFFYAVNYYQGFKEKLINEEKLKSLIKEAELHALKSQINPHFLFNSLNSISYLTMADPPKAHEMVINLSSLMRYSLRHDQTEIVPFREELKNNQLYLKIEKVRFGSKLNPVFEICEECHEAQIPNMILQPLYENAIKYGVYEATEPVDIITKVTLKGNVLEIIISNNYDPDAVSKKGEGIGLRNIRDRLQVIYGNPMLMKISDNKKEFTVTLNIPQK